MEIVNENINQYVVVDMPLTSSMIAVQYGLQSGRRVESVLASMPPVAKWEYQHQPVENSPEHELFEFLNPVIGYHETNAFDEHGHSPASFNVDDHDRPLSTRSRGCQYMADYLKPLDTYPNYCWFLRQLGPNSLLKNQRCWANEPIC